MINLDDEVILNFNESCTKEEAIAKMLGWMRGHKRLKYIEMNKFNTGIIAKHLPYMNVLVFPLEDQLAALREVARNELLDVGDAMVEAKKSGDQATLADLELKCSEKADALDRCECDILNAITYLKAFNDEISKGAASSFIVDENATKNSDNTYFVIGSLDKWSRDKFGISVIDEVLQDAEITIITKSQNSKRVKTRNDELDPYIDEIVSSTCDLTPIKVMTKLRQLAGTKNCCILESLDEGVKWQKNNGNVRILNIKALNSRLRERRKLQD